jgi:hypothetical protein
MCVQEVLALQDLLELVKNSNPGATQNFLLDLNSGGTCTALIGKTGSIRVGRR